ncbi:3-phosphoshikimate 1-carboxyvinyltransferase [soil metagenome]
MNAPLADPLAIEPLTRPVDANVVVPGSKSITNRALVAAALAAGESRLDGVLLADDTDAMIDSLGRLGVGLDVDRAAHRITVVGTGGHLAHGPLDLHARLSGTTARFLAPLVAIGPGPYRLDAGAPMRRRSMGPVIDALRALGAEVREEGEPGHLPFVVAGGGLAGGEVVLPGDISSQFLSGLLLAAPAMAGGLRATVSTALVSRPYVELTAAVMAAFGVAVAQVDDRTFAVAAGRYRACRYAVEPDASAASYLFAAAAICGGRVRVAGLGRSSQQGDLAFVEVLAAMGAEVTVGDDATEVVVHGALHGGEFDLGDLSDTAQTLAAVAVFATGPTRVTGIGFIRGKETDRIAAVVAELRRCGIDADEEPDGFVVRPGAPRPAVIETYHDHRMAMSFALLGLRAPGIAIADPGCVAKTFPGYFAALDQLRSPPGGGR